MNRYAPDATNPVRDVDPGPLESLSPAQRRVIVRLMARVAERSYRRGLQQGATARKDGKALPADLHAWRYGNSLDASPAAVGPARVESSIARLMIENPALRTFLPEDAPRVTVVDIAEAAQRLTSHVEIIRAEHERGAGDSPRVIETKQAIRCIGVELAASGPHYMSAVYDLAQQGDADFSTQWVSPAWDGIGGWSA